MRAFFTYLALSGAALAAAVPLSCSSSHSSGGSGASSGSGGGGDRDGGVTYPDGGVTPTPACQKGTGTAPVAAPVLLWNKPTDTGWFSSPAITELSDGKTKTRALVVA